MTALIAALALIVGFQLGAGWVIERGYGPFLWGFTHPFSRRAMPVRFQTTKAKVNGSPLPPRGGLQ